MSRKERNGVFLDIEDFSQVLHSLSKPPVFVNDIDVNDIATKEKLKELLMTRYESDTLESIPTCECKSLRGGNRAGLLCKHCGTYVQIPTERPIESTLWIRAPDEIKGLINPAALTILRQTFKKSGVSVIDWLIDRSYVPPKNRPVVDKLIYHGFQKGSLNWFIENFDNIYPILCSSTAFSSQKKPQLQRMSTWIKRNRWKLFPEALPIPSKLAFIVEAIDVGTYADHSMADALQAVKTIASIHSGIVPPTLREKERKTVVACNQLANFYELQYGKPLGAKPGWFRRHVFGSRPAFSFRAVISSLFHRHRLDEIHLPWSLAVALLKLHLYNKFLKLEGWNMRKIVRHIAEHTLRYDPLIHQFMEELIAEARSGKGIPILLNRNPSLKRLSIQRLYLTKVKTNVRDKTISLSVLILKGYNADPTLVS